MDYTTMHPSLEGLDVNPLIRLDSPEDVAQKRRDLVEHMWLGGLPAFSEPEEETIGHRDPRYTEGSQNTDGVAMPSLKRLDRLLFKSRDLYGVESIAYLFKTTSSLPNRLMIFVAGHQQDFFVSKNHVMFWLNRGYDVLAFSMPFAGMNPKQTLDCGIQGPVKMYDHYPLSLLENQGFRTVRFFMEPIIRGLNYCLEREDYPVRACTGYSGGGWACTIAASLTTQLDCSYPTACSQPRFCAALPPNHSSSFGDVEQNASYLEVANYLELYVLGACPDPGGKPRRQMMCSGLYDPVVAAGVNHRAYSAAVRDRAASLGGSWAPLVDSALYEHKISDWARSKVAEDLAL